MGTKFGGDNGRFASRYALILGETKKPPGQGGFFKKEEEEKFKKFVVAYEYKYRWGNGRSQPCALQQPCKLRYFCRGWVGKRP